MIIEIMIIFETSFMIIKVYIKILLIIFLVDLFFIYFIYIISI